MYLLVAIDFSETTERIIEIIKKISAEKKVKVFLIHVVPPEPDFIGYKVGPETERNFVAKRFHERHIQLQEIAANLRISGIQTTPLLIQGPTTETIIEQAVKLYSDIIIAGSHGNRKMKHLLMGSVCKGLIKNSTIPVLIVPSIK